MDISGKSQVFVSGQNEEYSLYFGALSCFAALRFALLDPLLGRRGVLQQRCCLGGVGDASQNSQAVEACLDELSQIAGQRGVVTRSKKAIAGFKIREDMPVGVSVTLRGERMYAFLDRLINLALPRIRDFQGVNPKSFDGHGNYSLGLEEQLMFPEIDYDAIDRLRGMDISIVTSASTDQESLALLRALGMPFRINTGGGN